MGTAGATHRWMFWTFAHDYPSLSDEFVVVPEGFRVRLMGTSLELSHEGLGQSLPETAALLADPLIESRTFPAALATDFLAPRAHFGSSR